MMNTGDNDPFGKDCFSLGDFLDDQPIEVRREVRDLLRTSFAAFEKEAQWCALGESGDWKLWLAGAFSNGSFWQGDFPIQIEISPEKFVAAIKEEIDIEDGRLEPEAAARLRCLVDAWRLALDQAQALLGPAPSTPEDWG